MNVVVRLTAAGARLPRRYVGFAGLCLGWWMALLAWPTVTLVRAAGLGWFVCWGVQSVVSIGFWARPLSLPAWYYRPLPRTLSRRVARGLGLALFARVAGWVNPLRVVRGAAREVDTVMRAAETTHGLSFLAVFALTVWAVRHGAEALAICLGLYNVFFNLYPVALQRHNRDRLQAMVSARQAVRMRRAAS